MEATNCDRRFAFWMLAASAALRCGSDDCRTATSG